MNLPPDISCKIGPSANFEAYCKHYNRLGAVDIAATALNAHLAVHTTPSPSCAAEAPLHTPPSEQGGGRSKGNGAAQDGAGPTSVAKQGPSQPMCLCCAAGAHRRALERPLYRSF